MLLNHNQKIEVFELVWIMDTKVKQLRFKLETIRITTYEDNLLKEVENKIKEVQLYLHNSLPEKPKGYVFTTLLN